MPSIPHPMQPPITGFFKTCAKCGLEKLNTNFYAGHGKCKQCVIERVGRYQASHKAEHSDACRRWLTNNPEKRRQSVKQSNERHREQRSNYNKEYRVVNATRERDFHHTYYLKHKTVYNLRSAEWAKSHPDFTATKNQKRRARKLGAGRHYTNQEWVELKFRYNLTCLSCNRSEPDIKLTADHIVPLSRGGSNNIGNIQPLCLSCNCRKGIASTDYRTRV